MKKSFKLQLIALVMISVLLPCFAQSSQKNQAPKEFVIHHIGDITGPYASITGAAGAYSAPDSEKYFNENGGLKGVKIRIVMHDTSNKRDVALAKYAEIAASKPALIILHQSSDMEILKERLQEDKIPVLGFSPTPKTIWPKGWIFQILPPYQDQFAFFIDWLRTNWKKEGTIRMAFVNPDYSYGHSIFSPETEKYMKEKGIEVVAKEFFPPHDMDATTQMSRVAKTKPDVIYSMTIATQPRVILKSAETVGLVGEVLFGMGCWGMDRGGAAVAGRLMEGVVGVQPFWVPYDTKRPIVKHFVDDFIKKGRPPEQITMAYAGFILVNAIAIDALSKTIDRVGWDKLEGQEVYNTLEETKNYDTRGLQPFMFTEGTRSSAIARIVKIENGDVVPLSDWSNCPDMRPAEYK